MTSGGTSTPLYKIGAGLTLNISWNVIVNVKYLKNEIEQTELNFYICIFILKLNSNVDIKRRSSLFSMFIKSVLPCLAGNITLTFEIKFKY